MGYYHDLSRYQWRRETSGYTVIGGWSLDEDDQWHRTMYVMREGDYGEDPNRVWYLIDQPENAWIIMDSADSGRQDFAFDKAKEALETMGLQPHLSEIIKLVSVINGAIGDLMMMLPEPPGADDDAPETADIIVTDASTGNTREIAVKDPLFARQA